MKAKLVLCVVMLPVWAFVNSCKKDPADLGDGPSEPIDSNYEWVDATVQLPGGSGYKLDGHELTAVGSQVKINADGATKVPKRTDAVSIYLVTDATEKPVLMGYSTPQKTEISPEATAKVALFNLYRVATMPLDTQIDFFEAFDDDAAAQAYVAAFVEHWSSNPTTLATKSYLNIVKNYHGRSETNYRELSAKARNKVMGDEGRYYFVESADTGKTHAGYTMRIEDGNKFHLVNKGPGRGTAFVYKMRRKGNTDAQFIDLITSFTPDTRADNSWFIDGAEYVPMRQLITNFVVDYRAISNGVAIFSDKVSGPHELPLGDDDVEAQYAIRIIDAGVNVREGQLTNAEFEAYVKHVHASLIIDYYLPFLGTYMGLDIQDFYALDGQECVDRLDAAIREAGLHTSFDEHIREGQLGRLLILLETYFQSADTEYGLKLHQAVAKAVGKSGSASMVSAAKRAGYLSYYFDDNIFWDAEDERVRFLQYYLETHGLTTLEATARAGIVRVSPRFPRVTSLAPNNRVELEATIESEEFKGLDVTYHWSTAGQHGIVSADKDKAIYVALENTSEYGDVFESVYAEARKDGQLVGRDSATVHISRSRYRMVPEHATLTGDPEKGPNVVTMRIEPKGPDALNLNDNPTYDFRIDWSTDGKYGGIRWQGRYATYWTTETETYNQNSVQYYCTDDQVTSGEEVFKATIYAKPKGSSDSYYAFYDYLLGSIAIRNGEPACDEIVEFFVAFEQRLGFGEPTIHPTTGQKVYNGGSPSLFATYPSENCSPYYEFRVVYKDGTKSDWFSRTAYQLGQEGDTFTYTILIGGLRAYLGMSESEALKKMEEHQKLLDEHRALGIDVRVRR